MEFVVKITGKYFYIFLTHGMGVIIGHIINLLLKLKIFLLYFINLYDIISTSRCFISSKVNMLEFNTKADLLRRLGKYSKDVRLVDRMMKRGEVVYEGHVYKLVPRKDVNSLIDLVMSFCGTEEERGKIREVIKKILYNNNK